MKIQVKLALILLAIFFALSIIRQNYEFLFYAFTLIVLVYVLIVTDRKYNLSNLGLWGFNVWLLSHLLGGLVSIKGIRLYDVVVVPLIGSPFYILKYDQVVHILCYFVITILVYDVIKKIADKKTPKISLFVLIFLAATGVGGLNELIEYLAFVFLGSTGVGDYYNTGLDFIANAFGSLLALLYLKNTIKS